MQTAVTTPAPLRSVQITRDGQLYGRVWGHGDVAAHLVINARAIEPTATWELIDAKTGAPLVAEDLADAPAAETWEAGEDLWQEEQAWLAG